jgi:tetratricopeptide (TPR) repeat protein
MGIGILHAMIGVVPDQYQWALELFGFYGTIDQGMNEVRDQLAISEYHAFQQEALFYYTFLRLNLQNDSSRSSELLNFYQNETFKEKSASSPLLSFSKAILLMRFDNDAAIQHLKNDYSLYQNSDFYYPIFLLGQTLLYQLNEDCETYLNEYISNYQGKNFKKTALQRLAWWSFINDQPDIYFNYMQRVKTEGNSLLDSDKSAVKEAKMAEEGQLPNKYLLKARILFDGHYYHKALEELKKLDKQNLNAEELLEFHYRMGRIYHKQGGEDLAIESYQLAINEGHNSERYFAGKAALKMGEIEESRSNYQKAEKAYKKCLELDFSEYRRGIRAKAKAGLQRLQHK